MGPDIAMCSNEECDRKDTCYRFTAVPNPYRQSYAMFNHEDCDNYIECRSKGQQKRLDIQCEGER